MLLWVTISIIEFSIMVIRVSLAQMCGGIQDSKQLIIWPQSMPTLKRWYPTSCEDYRQLIFLLCYYLSVVM